MAGAFVAGGDNLPKLAAVVERQRRELAALRAQAHTAGVIAMARGALMERHGWSASEAARHLADMAAAAGLPEPEMAAAALSHQLAAAATESQPPQSAERVRLTQEPATLSESTDGPAATPTRSEGQAGSPGTSGPTAQRPTAQRPTAQRPTAQHPTAQRPTGEWLEDGTVPGSVGDVLAMAAAERAKDGAELVGVLAAQLRARFGAGAAAVWLLEVDGALELFGQDGLGGTEASRWRRLPPQLDCLEQRVVTTEADLWHPAGPPAAGLPAPGPSDSGLVPVQVPVPAPFGRGAARAVLGLRDRAGTLLGVVEVWWPTPRAVLDVSVRAGMAATLAGFADVLALRLAYGPVGVTAPSPTVFSALDQIADSVLIVRPLRDAAGAVTDFAVVHLSPGYTDPAGRPPAALAGLTLLEAYPASGSGDGLFARAERVLASGRAEHGPDGGAGALTGEADTAGVAALHAVPFFAGVLFAWRTPREAERAADVLDHAQRLSRLGGWEEDLATGSVRWTTSTFALFGLDPEHAAAIPTASLHSFVIAADRAPVARFREMLLHQREPAVAVFRIVRPGDVAIRQIRIFAEPVVAGGGEVVGLRGAFQDVSAHYHTQVALAATQDQLADSEQRAEQEQQLALRLQRAIMPEDESPVPELGAQAGVDVAVRYRPAEDGHLVAGDWYDALLMPDKELLIVVGDITGHGIDAVTGMIAARNALRGLAATGGGPADLLRHLNYAACHLTEGIAGTVICGRYSPETRILRWARAGHLPPVLVRDGAAEMLPLPSGVLLGLDPDAEYEEATLQMRSGDTLLLFTDGLIERRADSISDALREFTAAAVPSGPDAAAHADRILATTISDTGDDTCLVAVRIL